MLAQFSFKLVKVLDSFTILRFNIICSCKDKIVTEKGSRWFVLGWVNVILANDLVWDSYNS